MIAKANSTGAREEGRGWEQSAKPIVSFLCLLHRRWNAEKEEHEREEQEKERFGT